MRLIDADTLHKALSAKQKWVVHYGDKYNEGYTSDQVHFAIDDAPTVEVVSKNETTTEVVRCKDCKHYYADPWGWGNCVFDGGVSRRTKTNDFCSWGERKDD